MDDLAPPEPSAAVRLSQDQAQQLVLRTVATEAQSLLRTAQRHSLCIDDAHDAYQRSMEIFMRRASTLDPMRASRWLHVVVKHEAKAVRESRTALVAREDIDFDQHVAADLSLPEERVIDADRVTRAAEALRRLKPDELRAVWLRALGKSYHEISQETSWSPTKVNRCLAEGRKSFLERFAGIESGAECERWQPMLSALVDGEASPEQLADLRPHLRRCPACRATVRTLHDAERSLLAVLPIGLVGLGAKVGGLLERVLPVAVGAEPAAAAGGAGLLGAGGLKLAALVATGAVAVGGGGAAVVRHERPTSRTVADAPLTHKIATRPAVASTVAAPATSTTSTPTRSVAATSVLRTAPRSPTTPSVVRRPIELKPAGREVTLPVRAAPASAPLRAARPASTPPVPSTAPRSTIASDTSASDEFAPNP